MGYDAQLRAKEVYGVMPWSGCSSLPTWTSPWVSAVYDIVIFDPEGPFRYRRSIIWMPYSLIDCPMKRYNIVEIG